MQIFGRNISFSKVQDVSKARPEDANLRKYIQKLQQQVHRVKEDVQKWRNATTSAESILNPQRFNLYRVYNDIVLDAHLTAAMQQRKNLILSRNFKIVDKAGKENEEKTKLIKKKWFREFLDLAMDSRFYGHSLIQFDSLENDEFKEVELVPRIYVKPEFHIVVEYPTNLVGIDYLESPYKEWCIGVGKSRDLGLLLKAAPLVIWKKNAIGAWSVFQDAFGTPLVKGKTNTRDEATRLNMENAVRSLSTGLSVVMDTDDEIDLLETTKQDAHQVFDMLIQRCNSELSKLILGQTSTMDEKSFVGSAEVQERVLQGYAELDEHFIEGVLNYQLIPFLNNLGFGLDGFTIECKQDEDLTIQERIKVDAELMKYFELDPEYILETYGTPVEKKVEPVDTGFKEVQNKLTKYYS